MSNGQPLFVAYAKRSFHSPPSLYRPLLTYLEDYNGESVAILFFCLWTVVYDYVFEFRHLNVKLVMNKENWCTIPLAKKASLDNNRSCPGLDADSSIVGCHAWNGG